MSQKRHRQQQRRQRRKAAGRACPDRRAPRARQADRELAELLAGMAVIAARDAHQPSDALEAEQWASGLIGTWHVRPMPGEDVEGLFFPGFVDALEKLGTARALATLRALSTVGAGDHGRRARAAADRLAAGGRSEPPWAEALGGARPTTAALMYDEAFDDGVSVLVEFASPDDGPHTLGIYIDHNMGGLVKDVFLAGPLHEVRAELDRRAAAEVGPAVRDLGLAEARTRVEAALDMLDHTYDPPVSEDVRPLRALIDARIGLLPDGFEPADHWEEMAPSERDELLSDFLASCEGRRWRGDEAAEDVVDAAIEFGVGYNHGGALRWSPVVVEIFMTSWLPRKVARGAAFHHRVPHVLADWVAYAGRRRGVAAPLVGEAVGAVGAYREEFLHAVDDPQAWGPAKTFAVTAQQAGVDLSDPDAVGRFLEDYNQGLAA